jgi:LuxR family transcriptional regulator
MLNLQLDGTELTKAEVKALRCVARGLTLQEAADELHKGRETIKSQIRMARGRLGAKNTTHAVAIALSLDLI